MKLNDLKRQLEDKKIIRSQEAMLNLMKETLVEVCDEIRTLHACIAELERKERLSKYSGCRCKHE